MIPSLPSTASPVHGKDDAGRRVIVNSTGGALYNVTGTVIAGPFTFTYNITVEDKIGRRKQKTVGTKPYWQVLMDTSGLYLNFIETELTFI